MILDSYKVNILCHTYCVIISVLLCSDTVSTQNCTESTYYVQGRNDCGDDSGDIVHKLSYCANLLLIKFRNLRQTKKVTSWIAYSQVPARFDHCQVTGQLPKAKKDELIVSH